MSLIRTKHPHTSDEIYGSFDANPSLAVVLAAANTYCQYMFLKDICVTRVYPVGDEPDPHGLHRAGRAADIRVYHPDRDGHHTSEITYAEAQDLVEWINATFHYGRRWNLTLTFTAHLIGEGPNIHIHIQTKNRKGWRPK